MACHALNAIREHHVYCSQEGIQAPPLGLNMWLTNAGKKGHSLSTDAAAPMLKQMGNSSMILDATKLFLVTSVIHGLQLVYKYYFNTHLTSHTTILVVKQLKIFILIKLHRHYIMNYHMQVIIIRLEMPFGLLTFLMLYNMEDMAMQTQMVLVELLFQKLGLIFAGQDLHI
jgi:hypothetical protein